MRTGTERFQKVFGKQPKAFCNARGIFCLTALYES
jgi:hypothetical protein